MTTVAVRKPVRIEPILLGLVTAFGLGCGPKATTTVDDYVDNNRNAKLTVTGLPATAPNGSPTTSVAVRLDGELVDRCPVPLPSGGPCVNAQPIAPGPHTIDFVIRCTDAAAGGDFGCIDHSFERVHAAPREHITYDVAAFLKDRSNERGYRSRKGGPRFRTSVCIRSLERLTYAPSCDADDVDGVIKLAGRARRSCTAADFEGKQGELARALVDSAIRNHFHQPLERCFGGPQLGAGRHSVPARVRAAWPEGTIEQGSWVWARATMPEDASSSGDARERLRTLRKNLQTARPRVAALADITAAYLDDGKIGNLHVHALEQPWSFDPNDPNGHRHWYIVADGRFHAEAYDRELANHLAADGSINCSQVEAANILVPYLLDGERLTTAAWDAVKAMVQRTPADQDIGVCIEPFVRELKTEASEVDRLRWLGKWDCSDARDQERRGRALEGALAKANPEHGDEIRKELADCLKR